MTKRHEDARTEAARWLAAQARWQDRLEQLEGCFRPAALETGAVTAVA